MTWHNALHEWHDVHAATRTQAYSLIAVCLNMVRTSVWNTVHPLFVQRNPFGEEVNNRIDYCAHCNLCSDYPCCRCAWCCGS